MKIKLVDSTFSHNLTIGLAGENEGELPESFQWDTTPGPAKVKVFTDIRLREAADDDAERKILLLVEAPCLSEETYKRALEFKRYFDVILTHNRELIETHGKPFYYYPFGGNWIRRWGLFPKSKDVSVLMSSKQDTRGQRLRHEIAKEFGDQMDVFGDPRLPTKTPALRDYRYSVIIENCKEDWWFTEKLIDCFSQGTIPIYWGCPSIQRFFNARGMWTFDTVKQLRVVLSKVSERDYMNRLAAVTTNFAAALHYRCAEDWIVDSYPWIFEEGQRSLC
jgi:hypothetical protein